MADLGPQIVTGLTAIVSFSAGLVAESLRHRNERKARHQDERIAVYGRYISALRQWPTNLSAHVTGTESPETIMARLREHEELVGPVRLYANEEVREALEDLNRAGTPFWETFQSLMAAGMDAPDAAAQAWSEHDREPTERLETAMRRHLDLEPLAWWRRKVRRR